MTLDYTKRFRWQEAGSQGSFHMWGSPHGQYETDAAFVFVTSFGLARFVTAE